MTASRLRFECTQCGRCCTHRGEYAHVYLDRAEVEDLADLLGTTVRSFRNQYTFVDESGWFQLRTVQDRCIFLDPDTKGCRVYERRPTQCRTFPFWRDFTEQGEWTAEVREMCEGIDRGRLYSIEEVEVRMVEMEEADRD